MPAAATATAPAVPTVPATPPPSVHRRALITWLAIYPTVTAVVALIGGATAGLPLPVQTMILTAVVVPVAVYVLVPALMKANTSLTRRTTRAPR
ncbi:hypothetical protein J7E97_24365 [Streptomyces sp. ISL-66]|nr:hypothetical protein [Streptomyces sp. ISL-66]